jgi:hypothetical protein
MHNKDITIHSIPARVNSGFKLVWWLFSRLIKGDRIEATLSDNTYQYTDGEELK